MTVLTYETPTLRRQRVDWAGVLAKLGPIIGLLFVFALFAVLTFDTFVTIPNIELMLRLTAVVAMGALGMTLIIVSGGIDLSVGSNIALCTVVIALLLKAGVPPALAALGGAMISAACGLAIGTMVVGYVGKVFSILFGVIAVAWLWHAGLFLPLALFLGIVIATGLLVLDHFFMKRIELAPFIVTLGTWGALRGAAEQLADNSMVYPPDTTWLNQLLKSVGPATPASFRAVSWGFLGVLVLAWLAVSIALLVNFIWGYAGPRWKNAALLVCSMVVGPAVILLFVQMQPPLGVWLMLAMSLGVAAMLRYTRFGRHVFAIGSNEQTARLCGVSVERNKTLIYTLGAAFAGIAGILQFSYLTMGDPTTANGMELDIIAAVVIGGASLSGGQGSILGTVVGALIMTMVSNGCTKLGLENPIQKMVTGGIIVFAVALDRLRQRHT